MKLRYLGIALSLLLLVGCGVQTEQATATQPPVNSQQSSNQPSLNQQIEQLEDNIQDLETKIEDLEATNKEEVEIAFVPFYTVDENWMGVEPSSIQIPVTENIEESLNNIGSILSTEEFYDLPIEVVGVGIVDGKKIANINLKEDYNSDMSWENSFFQGSTGGQITVALIEENFLQRNYSGEWIDGIIVTYEGERPSQDHVPEFGETIYR
ncbi:MAG: hypothetical protein ATN36_02140 [Epulopiscium sp. Nele67-Bin005]|nr:MAG: hypothetical protein ATN36_02140 [Epulopiscium sp. Nele67-Bin005]